MNDTARRWHRRNAFNMAALIPGGQPSNVEAAYEDMFKEITRKLYGEETGNGLHPLGTPVAQVATSGPTAPEGERSFTTLQFQMSDRNLAPQIEYDHNGGVAEPSTTSGGNFKSEDHLTTAFGLAALMQNGFATSLNPQTLIKTASNENQANGNAANGEQDARWSTSAANAAEEIVQWPTGGKLSAFVGQKQIKNTKPRDTTPNEQLFNNPVAAASSAARKPKNPLANVCNTSTEVAQIQSPKRYGCSHCPYSTDRRDLYTRHENIHKDEKPFQCYACLKQFNRADHVKKHFLRMHRELTYDINKTRRSVASTSSQPQVQQQLPAPVDQKPIIFSNAQAIAENFLSQQQQQGAVQETASSLSIAQTIESVASASTHAHLLQMKQEKMAADDKALVKVKKEKRFTCCYCPWSGADKWGLKRHLNTHTKPFVCMLCDYKAARSERLATHVLKVHNKRACNKCSFLADNQEDFQIHLNDVHPHDQRPARSGNGNSVSSNANVLRTISNNLVANNQINNFQTPSTSFGGGTGNGVTIYTNNDLSAAAGGNGANIPLQEIIVNPASMMGWRLSANGTLIPPDANSTNQKRGAERLFQYLEADGSDPEDYARQLKMDAMSRNTASVAQDFHNAGGDYHHHHHNNQKTDAACHRASNNSSPMDWDTDGSESAPTPSPDDQRQAMSLFLSNNFQLKAISPPPPAQPTPTPPKTAESDAKQPKKSSPAFKSQSATKSNHNNNTISNSKGHRRTELSLGQDKENANVPLFPGLENINLAKFEQQFQNYVKEVINRYYQAEKGPAPQQPKQQPKQKRSETEEYIEYLKNKEDITLTITSKKAARPKPAKVEAVSPVTIFPAPKKSKSLHSLLQARIDATVPVPAPVAIANGPLSPTSSREKRNRKQSQPKKVRNPPEVVVSMLRDKYLNNLVRGKRACLDCAKRRPSTMGFPYHTHGSLALHRLWRHPVRPQACPLCDRQFRRPYSLAVHLRVHHRN